MFFTLKNRKKTHPSHLAYKTWQMMALAIGFAPTSKVSLTSLLQVERELPFYSRRHAGRDLEKRMRTTVVTLLVGALLSGVICYAQSSSSSNDSGKSNAISGQWGGESARMEVAGNGATLEFGCANGDIVEPLKLDEHGRFRAKGTFQAQGPGPSREPDQANPNADYSGVVKGDTMQLTVLVDGDKEVQKYTLTRGRKTKLLGCK